MISDWKMIPSFKVNFTRFFVLNFKFCFLWQKSVKDWKWAREREREKERRNSRGTWLKIVNIFTTSETRNEVFLVISKRFSEETWFIHGFDFHFYYIVVIWNDCFANFPHGNFFIFLQGYEGEPPILLKEEPEDGPTSFHKVPSLSDLSEESLGEFCFHRHFNHRVDN